MEKIIEISGEILNLYRILESKENITLQDKNKLLKKIEELCNIENHLFSMLNISIEMYDDYIGLIHNCNDFLIITRLENYLNYLYSLNKVLYLDLMHLEYANENSRYYKYFYLEKELEKIIIKNSNINDIYYQLFMDKLLELDYFNNNYKLKKDNIDKRLTKKELNLYKKSKYNYIKDQLINIIKLDKIEDNIIVIKSLLEFSDYKYDEYYNIIIDYLNTLEDKTKLNTFINIFGKSNKLK